MRDIIMTIYKRVFLGSKSVLSLSLFFLFSFSFFLTHKMVFTRLFRSEKEYQKKTNKKELAFCHLLGSRKKKKKKEKKERERELICYQERLVYKSS